METDITKITLTFIGLILTGIGIGLNKFFKTGEYFKRLIYQLTFGRPLTISLIIHPFFNELQSFIEVDQHHAYFPEKHRNYIFVKYLLIFTKSLHHNFIEFSRQDLDRQFKTMEEFEAALQSLYNRTFGSCLLEVKQKFTFNESMLFRIQIHQEESLEVFKLGIKRILDDTTFDYDREPNKRKMWRILDSLAQGKDEYKVKTRRYFKELNGQMANVEYKD